jgi:hypothetical protein
MVSFNAAGFQYSGHNAKVSTVQRNKFCLVLQASSFALERQKTSELRVPFSGQHNAKICELITVEIRSVSTNVKELKPYPTQLHANL